MTRRRLIAVFVTLAGCLFAPNPGLGQVQRVDFSLQVGQWATAGDYMIRFNGLLEGFPAYDLFLTGGTFLASFSASPAGPFNYQNLSVATIAVTSGGTVARGTLTVR